MPRKQKHQFKKFVAQFILAVIFSFLSVIPTHRGAQQNASSRQRNQQRTQAKSWQPSAADVKGVAIESCRKCSRRRFKKGRT